MSSHNSTLLQQVMSDILQVPPSAITDKASMQTIATWDSLAHLNLVLAIEEAFGVRFNSQVIPTLISVAAIKNELEKLHITFA